MKQLTLLPIMWSIAALVGLYQTPLVDNTLMKHQIMLNLDGHFPYPQQWQQYLEDSKISFDAFLDYRKKTPKNIEKIAPIAVAKADESASSATVTHLASVSNGNGSGSENGSSNNNNGSGNGNGNGNGDNGNNSGNNASTSSSNTANSNETVTASSGKEACKQECTVLMIGDSVMGDVDYSLERLLKKNHPDWQVIDAHKVSSGLTNQNYYNWPKTANQLLSKYQPDYTVVLIGTNDAQGMLVNGKAFALGNDGWNAEYSNRIHQMIDMISSNSGQWMWIELPVVRDSGFNQRLAVIRRLQADATGTHLLETESIFGKIDHSQPVNMQLRAGDGIHLNSSGANLVANHIYDYMSKNYLK
jgi:lysophospholipase L1-like esterase